MHMSDADKIRCVDIYSKKNNYEDVLIYLRDNGYSQLKSILAIKEMLSLSPYDAKRMVHCSETWSDVRTQVDALHDKLESLSEFNEE